MKRFFALIASFLFLFVMIAPVISLAAQNPNNFISNVSKNSLYTNTYIINSTDSNLVWSIGFVIENHIGYVTSALYAEDGVPCIAIHFFDGSPNSTVTVKLQFCNLISGDIYYESYSRTLNSQGKYDFYRKRQTCPLPVYYYVYHSVDTINQINNTNLILVDPFVSFPILDPYNFVYSSIPEPVADSKHIYFADYQYLYEIVIPFTDFTYLTVDPVYNHPDSYTGSLDSGFYLTYNLMNNNNQIDIACYQTGSNSINSYDLFVYKYILSNGQFESMDQYTSNNGRINCSITLSYNYRTYGLWISPYITSFTPDVENRLQVIWASGSAIHSDFLAINSLLNSIISTQSNINVNLSSFLNIADQYFQWFKNTYYNNWQDYWVAYLQKFTDMYIELQAIDIMMYQYILPDLQAIKNALVDHTESQPDTSEFDDSISEYEECESYVVNQAEVALDNLESQMSGAADVLTVNSSGLLFVKNIFETFAFSGMNYYYILFVLVLGSVALLIGRRLR